jgi:hypothetical protein
VDSLALMCMINEFEEVDEVEVDEFNPMFENAQNMRNFVKNNSHI